MTKNNAYKAVFFDRDGVFNHDHGYINKKEDFYWIDGAKEAVKLCQAKGYKTFVVTNQSGIARGLYSEENVKVLHNFIQEELQAIGASIDEYAYCPHHPEGKVQEYSFVCECRKPAPGMILKLAQKHNIDLENSFIIGDNPRDVEAGNKAGMQGYLFTGLNLLDFVNNIFIERGE